MNRDLDDFRDDHNPYAAPTSAIGRGRSGALEAAPPPPGSVFSIEHDLDDHDLRRLPDFDLFYDPLPLLGFIPQWVILSAIMFAFGSCAVWSRHRSFPAALAVGLLAAVASLFGLGKKAADNRRAARDAGVCDGRRATISGDGLRIVIAGRPTRSVFGVGEATHAWRDFRSVEFREGYLMFWKAGRARLVIPVRAFGTPDKAEAFAQAAAGWIADAR